MKVNLKKFNAQPQPAFVEQWSTRFGLQVRIVKRDAGKFVTNVSAKQLVK